MNLLHIPLDAYARKGDGESYVRYARAILGDASQMTDYDRRVFPGYPVLIAVAHVLTRLPFSACAVAIDLISASIAAALAAMLFTDRRIGWATAMLLPHYVINSALAMSEAPVLAVTLAGLTLAIGGKRRLAKGAEGFGTSVGEGIGQRSGRSIGYREIEFARVIAGGALLGFACLIRPMACFAAIGAVLAELLIDTKPRGETSIAATYAFRRAAAIAVSSAVIFSIGILILHRATGDALAGVRVYASSPRAYGGQLFTWPFGSLIATPFRPHVSWPRILYIDTHVAIVLLACAILAKQVLQSAHSSRLGELTEGSSRQSRLAALSAVWLIGNALFVLCIGSTWGFAHFPRFTIPAEPALFYAVRRWLPESTAIWLVLAGGLLVLGVLGVKSTP